MSTIPFTIKCHAHHADAVYLSEGDDPYEELGAAVLYTLGTDVEITIGGVTMHLAAWLDPDHWQEDWEKAGVEDVDGLLSANVTAA